MNATPSMTLEQTLSAENAALRTFIRLLGLNPEKVAAAFADDAGDLMCKHMAVSALAVERDFSKSSFSEAGIDASNQFLDSLRQQ